MAWRNSRNRGGGLSPSGLTQSWRLWRHCCCRHGWYPLLVAPIVTAACLLDLYSSFSCDFIQVNVGFTPSNSAWNQSSVHLGPFYYQSEVTGGDSEFVNTFVDGCQPFSSDFEEQFISGDRTWDVVRIMAYISGSSGILATLTAWLLVFTPIPSCFFWPGVMLPAVMFGFLAEGSKFMAFDSSICQGTYWYPSGADSLPRQADSCQMGNTAYFAIAAGVTFFVSLVLVCLKAPEKRELRVGYGDNYINNYMSGAQILKSESSFNEEAPDASFLVSSAMSMSIVDTTVEDVDLEDNMEDNMALEDMYKTSVDGSHASTDTASSQDEVGSHSEVDLERGNESAEDDNVSTLFIDDDDDEESVEGRDDKSDFSGLSVNFPHPTENAASFSTTKSLNDEINTPKKISKTRLASIEQMQHHHSDELIDKCVADLTKSFLDVSPKSITE